MRFEDNARRALRHAAVGGALMLGLAGAFAQQTYPTAEAAMNAFGDAVARSDEAALKTVLGADFQRYIPPVGDDARLRFLAAWARSHSIAAQGDGRAAVAVGGDGWTLPIPIVRSAAGWQFDPRAGAEEMRIRRIGRNELAAMQALLAVRDAQLEYVLVDRDGNGVREYASKFDSTAGKRDGLYWPAKAGEAPSPLGPAFAAARAAGGGADAGYYGYRYRLLDSQGRNAPGGAYEYTVRGKKIGGFAVVAWPVKYGDTGVMTFMVSHDGIVYEKDLGPGTATHAAAIRRFDPDPTWKKSDASRP